MKTIIIYIFVISLLAINSIEAQQDPQYTQYMYNTMSVNPGYTGSRGHTAVVALHRSQWVGINGAPTTQTLGIDSPLGKNVGLGLIVINDKLGPANEFFVDANFSYTLILDDLDKKLSFGIKAGGRFFSADFTKGIYQNPDLVFENNIKNKFFATVGAGVYFHTKNSYLGLSIPNFIPGKYYNDIVESVATERTHFFLIGGRVFDINYNIKLKPSFLVKLTQGAPIIADLSVNALFYEKFMGGIAYRFDDSISALIGMKVTSGLTIGYAYDMTTTGLKNYNSGTHEIMIRFELLHEDKKLKSPRFF